MGTVTRGGHNALAHDGQVCVLVFIGLLVFAVIWNISLLVMLARATSQVQYHGQFRATSA